MPIQINAPRGTQDVTPALSKKWQFVENMLLSTAELYGFGEIRTPVFEHTELFERGVGDTTDVVQKEMYTFQDKGGRSITLRPEGTAGAVRAALQNGLLSGALPLRVCYFASCFRYEKPQAGRLREHHQFGAEVLGAQSPDADADLIALARALFDALDISGVELHINSIGCPTCRVRYYEALRAFLVPHLSALCETCRGRFEKNPLRILDCKSPDCAEQVQDAPLMQDFLCTECASHFAGLRKRLDLLDIDYTVDPKIVRGLDYYTKTVFEFISSKIGAQGTVLGGGRYDGLVEGLGGTATPALGFATGLERLLLQIEACGCTFPEAPGCDVYIAGMGEAARMRALVLCEALRAEGFSAECDCMDRSVKAQMKYADKLGAKYCAVLGETELESGTCMLKNMRGGTSYAVSLDNFTDTVYRILLESVYNGIIDAEPTAEKNNE